MEERKGGREERGRKEQRKGKKEKGRESEGEGRGRDIGKKRGEEGAGEGGKGAPAGFRNSLQYSPPQILDLSGRLTGKGVCGEGRREGEGKMGRER